MKKYLLFLSLGIAINSSSIFCMNEDERTRVVLYRVQQERVNLRNRSEIAQRERDLWQKYKHEGHYKDPVENSIKNHSNAWYVTHMLGRGTGTLLSFYGLNKLSTSTNFFTTHILSQKPFPKKLSLLLLLIPVAATGSVIGEIVHATAWAATWNSIDTLQKFKK